ncbi:hypothetical protein BJ508DRAFT_336550 [Ascobolus immersus RN42]|uniref:Endo-1,3(4)-beta-glucanase 1 carbohydrate binding domain-containing protein n=1 Tax=Ascobolus immersus RN42 TaxID=1160509 RepID=A0A3N4H838_ASCIM|nr:hypothetical protein BJ508DRAFT_336550 [Ascobolus immersus RN42]
MFDLNRWLFIAAALSSLTFPPTHSPGTALLVNAAPHPAADPAVDSDFWKPSTKDKIAERKAFAQNAALGGGGGVAINGVSRPDLGDGNGAFGVKAGDRSAPQLPAGGGQAGQDHPVSKSGPRKAGQVLSEVKPQIKQGAAQRALAAAESTKEPARKTGSPQAPKQQAKPEPTSHAEEQQHQQPRPTASAKPLPKQKMHIAGIELPAEVADFKKTNGPVSSTVQRLPHPHPTTSKKAEVKKEFHHPKEVRTDSDTVEAKIDAMVEVHNPSSSETPQVEEVEIHTERKVVESHHDSLIDELKSARDDPLTENAVLKDGTGPWIKKIGEIVSANASSASSGVPRATSHVVAEQRAYTVNGHAVGPASTPAPQPSKTLLANRIAASLSPAKKLRESTLKGLAEPAREAQYEDEKAKAKGARKLKEHMVDAASDAGDLKDEDLREMRPDARVLRKEDEKQGKTSRAIAVARPRKTQGSVPSKRSAYTSDGEEEEGEATPAPKPKKKGGKKEEEEEKGKKTSKSSQSDEEEREEPTPTTKPKTRKKKAKVDVAATFTDEIESTEPIADEDLKMSVDAHDEIKGKKKGLLKHITDSAPAAPVEKVAGKAKKRKVSANPGVFESEATESDTEGYETEKKVEKVSGYETDKKASGKTSGKTIAVLEDHDMSDAEDTSLSSGSDTDKKKKRKGKKAGVDEQKVVDAVKMVAHEAINPKKKKIFEEKGEVKDEIVVEEPETPSVNKHHKASATIEIKAEITPLAYDSGSEGSDTDGAKKRRRKKKTTATRDEDALPTGGVAEGLIKEEVKKVSEHLPKAAKHKHLEAPKAVPKIEDVSAPVPEAETSDSTSSSGSSSDSEGDLLSKRKRRKKTKKKDSDLSIGSAAEAKAAKAAALSTSSPDNDDDDDYDEVHLVEEVYQHTTLIRTSTVVPVIKAVKTEEPVVDIADKIAGKVGQGKPRVRVGMKHEHNAADGSGTTLEALTSLGVARETGVARPHHVHKVVEQPHIVAPQVVVPVVEQVHHAAPQVLVPVVEQPIQTLPTKQEMVLVPAAAAAVGAGVGAAAPVAQQGGWMSRLLGIPFGQVNQPQPVTVGAGDWVGEVHTAAAVMPAIMPVAAPVAPAVAPAIVTPAAAHSNPHVLEPLTAPAPAPETFTLRPTIISTTTSTVWNTLDEYNHNTKLWVKGRLFPWVQANQNPKEPRFPAPPHGSQEREDARRRGEHWHKEMGIVSVARTVAVPGYEHHKQCGFSWYNPLLYNCWEGDILCPIVNDSPLILCGNACYNPATYTCTDGTLVENDTGEKVRGDGKKPLGPVMEPIAEHVWKNWRPEEYIYGVPNNIVRPGTIDEGNVRGRYGGWKGHGG